MTDVPETDPTCAVAHGDDIAHGYAPAPRTDRALVAVFASPVAAYLLRYAADLEFRTVLVDPDDDRAAKADVPPDTLVAAAVPDDLDGADVVVTDHHRPELGAMLRDALAAPVRWIGVMGNPRHTPPHIAALRELGVADAEIDRVHRPIGLNIGSRTPPEIAVSTIAGLLADRAGRPGGFEF
ncbi:MAG TPA: XdhC family protein [Streptosporangiaceae bacterium]|jgi:xanthine/CO dehydrogenase XdhC/CoxF family maturation factor